MAYDVFDLYATDEKKELDGAIVELGKGVSVTVALAQNDNFLKRILEESERQAGIIKGLPEKEAKARDLKGLCEVLAETVLLGFKGMSYKGKPIKYTKANAVKLLLHREFRKMVLAHAGNLDNFRLKREEKEVKN